MVLIFFQGWIPKLLVLQPIFKYFQTFTNANFFAWKSKGLVEKSIETPDISDNSFTSKLTFIYNRRIGAKFYENCLL